MYTRHFNDVSPGDTAWPAQQCASVRLKGLTAPAQVAGMLTLDGRCKTLDASADGYVRAEAAIVVRLDPQDAASPAFGATAPGAIFLAGTFVNQDGRSSSLTAPNGPSQQLVIAGALAAAGAAVADVAALEMHGTGTPLGATQPSLPSRPQVRELLNIHTTSS